LSSSCLDDGLTIVFLLDCCYFPIIDDGVELTPDVLSDFFLMGTAKLRGIALEFPEGISALKQSVFSIFLPTNLLGYYYVSISQNALPFERIAFSWFKIQKLFAIKPSLNGLNC